jgi:hypothetical protein
MAYPPVGYISPYDRDSEMPRPELNTKLLLQLAQASGGEINPQSQSPLSRENVTKSYQPFRQALIVFAFVLFLLEIAA